MEKSGENIENNDNPNKITIKVKVAGEDFHDVLIDWSHNNDVGRQMFCQLSSITGIPLNSMVFCSIESDLTGAPNHWFGTTLSYTTRYPSTPDFYKSVRECKREDEAFEKLNNGDCYAVTFGFYEFWLPFRVDLYLYNCSGREQCTPGYCHYINNRAFLNRRIDIIKNGQQILRIHFGEHFMEQNDENYDHEDRERSLRSLGMLSYMNPICSFGQNMRVTHPYYPRTWG